MKKENIRKINYKKAATLSEMLITLVIIGIVFTIAAGTMVADYKKNETVVRLKKIYSTFSQAFIKAEMLNGSVQTWDIPSGSVGTSSEKFYKEYLSSVFAVMKDCKTTSEGECEFDFKELNGTQKVLDSSWVRFFLNDGTFVGLQTKNTPNEKVVYFYVDSNGKKRLNVVARDIFLFEYWIKNSSNPKLEGQFLPMGHGYSRNELISDSNENNCNRSKNGNYCAALIFNDGWEIKEGYPWAQARYVVK